MSEKSKAELKDLIQSLRNHKDAVVVIGDKCANKDLLKINENTKENYNRKNMIKNPKSFWEYYKTVLFEQDFSPTEAEQEINELIKTGIIKTIINLNYTDNIKPVDSLSTKIIELKGNVNILRCMSCDAEYSVINEVLNSSKIVKCECGGKIAPTITMFGEKYRERHISEIKKSIFNETENGIDLNTHVVIFIGVDFEEDYIHELIESFNAIKIQQNKEGYYCVMVCEKDGVSINYYQPEFATYEDIPGAINRLIDKINTEEI